MVPAQMTRLAVSAKNLLSTEISGHWDSLSKWFFSMLVVVYLYSYVEILSGTLIYQMQSTVSFRSTRGVWVILIDWCPISSHFSLNIIFYEKIIKIYVCVYIHNENLPTISFIIINTKMTVYIVITKLNKVQIIIP